MIIVRLQGGLGNQLFQYAAGRSLSLRRGTQLKFDSSLLHKRTDDTSRNYELGTFTCRQDSASAEDLKLFEFASNSSIGHRLVQKAVRVLFRRNVVFEDIRAPYRGRFEEFRGDLLLVGYWQTQVHFEEYHDVIRADLQFTGPMKSESEALARMLVDSNASFLHVRRGDYVQNSATNSWHGACSEEYYRAAITRLRQQARDCLIAVFSDDPQWCRSTFGDVPNLLFVDDRNSEGSTIDHLRLMSLCQNAIISNSSFSWWAAWLMNDHRKLVIAPDMWVADPVVNERMRDITPPEWVRL